MTNDEMVNALFASGKLGREMGIEEERDRIIKLLEGIKVINADQKFFVVQAIKGEQK